MKKILSIFITFFIVIVIIISFALNNSNVSNYDKTEKIKIIATLFPQYDFAKQIGKDKVEVTLLLPPGVEAHSYEPTPKDILEINNSNLFVYTGNEMEPWAYTVSKSISDQNKILEVSKGIEYIKEEDEQGQVEEAHEHEHELDPHIWLDICNAKIMVDNITKSLINLDKENEEYYIQNAIEYKSKLDRLDNEFIEVINNSKRNVVCFGDKFAYMYFINRYNLDYITVYDSCSVEAEPSISKVLGVEKKIQKENIPVIFYEALSEGKVAKSIAKDTNTKALVFSSVHTVSKEEIDGGSTYISVMEQNLENLKEALN